MKLCQVNKLGGLTANIITFHTESYYCEAHHLFIPCLFLIHTYVGPSGQERMSPPPLLHTETHSARATCEFTLVRMVKAFLHTEVDRHSYLKHLSFFKNI